VDKDVAALVAEMEERRWGRHPCALARHGRDGLPSIVQLVRYDAGIRGYWVTIHESYAIPRTLVVLEEVWDELGLADARHTRVADSYYTDEFYWAAESIVVRRVLRSLKESSQKTAAALHLLQYR
jgi:hypothetical protein